VATEFERPGPGVCRWLGFKGELGLGEEPDDVMLSAVMLAMRSLKCCLASRTCP